MKMDSLPPLPQQSNRKVWIGMSTFLFLFLLKRVSGWTDTVCNEDGKLEFLDRHHVTCSAGTALGSWKGTNYHWLNPWQFRIDYTCEGGIDPSSPTYVGNTGCDDTIGHDLVDLSREDVDCGIGYVMQNWRQTYDYCINNRQQILYGCVMYGDSSNGVHELETGCDVITQAAGSTGDIIYLDRHYLSCPAGSYMQGWRMVDCLPSQLHKFEYKCAYIPPTPAPSSSPSTSPSSEPTDFAPLDMVYEIPEPALGLENNTVKLDFQLSDKIDKSQVELSTTDVNGNPVPPGYFQQPVARDDGSPTGSGYGDRDVGFDLKIIPEAVVGDPNFYSETIRTSGSYPEIVAKINFAAKFTINAFNTTIAVNTLDILIELYYDLTEETTMDGSIVKRNRTEEDAEESFEVDAFFCDRNGGQVTTGQVYSQGSILTVCVVPMERAEGQGLVMRSIDSFSYYNGQGVIQPAVVNGFAAPNGLTELTCVRGSMLCSFETLLFADFFTMTGDGTNYMTVSGTGLATLQFPEAPTSEPSTDPSSEPTAAPSLSTTPTATSNSTRALRRTLQEQYENPSASLGWGNQRFDLEAQVRTADLSRLRSSSPSLPRVVSATLATLIAYLAV